MTSVTSKVLTSWLLVLAFQSPIWAADPQRQPAPPEAEQSEKLRLVTELYKPDYEKAKSANEQKALAEKIFNQAMATNNDPAGKFVLLKVATDVATKAGDWRLALKIQTQALTDYSLAADVNGNREKGSVLRRELLRESFRVVTNREQRSAITDIAISLGDNVAKDMAFDVAQGYFECALDLARRNQDGTKARLVVEKLDRTKTLAAQYEKVRAAMRVLEERPADKQANLDAGRFYCFVANDWKKGISMLALGSDVGLSGVATKELKSPVDAAGQLSLADSWWEIATQNQGDVANNIRRHAAVWYQQAAPGLEGLEQLKAQKRCEELKTIAASVPNPTPAPATPLKDGWHVVFRSSDPTMWGKDKSDEKNFSEALEKVPEKIQFLRLKRIDTGEFLIIPMSNEMLKGGQVSENLFWCRSTHESGQEFLGLSNVKWELIKKRPFLSNDSRESRGRGWGIGGRWFANNEKGHVYQWNGDEIKLTAFEIAVLTGKLPDDQMRFLLR